MRLDDFEELLGVTAARSPEGQQLFRARNADEEARSGLGFEDQPALRDAGAPHAPDQLGGQP